MGRWPSFVRPTVAVGVAAAGAVLPGSAAAQTGQALHAANTAWLLVATALVLFMTLPGLALFYGGLVRAKNLLSVLMHCFAIACLVSLLWLVFGYSLAFGDGGSAQRWIGGLGKAFLAGVDARTLTGGLPETVFFMFQMTFAIITPALIVGAYVERIRFAAVLWFSGLWLALVYAPVAHWIWGGGWLSAASAVTGSGVKDFAGGLVVHLTAGASALVAVAAIGPRTGFPDEVAPPHSPALTMIGASMLWVGWFGFNAGSALAADGTAGMTMVATHISAATGALVWMAWEWTRYGKPSLIGMVTGMVAGLASITPASGFVGPVGALVIGLLGGSVCYMVNHAVKQRFKTDDSLDVFAVHGMGGVLGALLTAVFAARALGGAGLDDGISIGGQLWSQAVGIAVVLVWSCVLTWVILRVVRAICGLRVGGDVETEGLDIAVHGERAYHT